ncbi:MAG: amidohydrolase family protein [Nitriliruptor sp.]|uniref:amidohydrolase family protein n=1 Tax=Nitriliruptor sp. TaxID=2448056 RepID=UPI0034A0663D
MSASTVARAGAERRTPTPQVVRGGTVFDGQGGDGVLADVVTRDGVVEGIVAPGTTVAGATEIDAGGCWVTPGFVDLHTHYDAELEVSPSLDESVRHGITTALIGSCGLSMAVGDPVDMADMFCRVEGIPRELVLPVLERAVTWDSPAEYLDHLASLPLGPNVTAMLGHSTIRAHAMGLERSLSEHVKPTRDELLGMGRLLRGALEAGYLGLSINTLPWDKMDGDRFRSRPTPSVFANWDEFRFLNRVLRRYGAVWQGVPDVSTKINVAMFLWESMPIGRRPPLRTMIISLADLKADRTIRHTAGALARLANEVFGADLRFQSLPTPFDMFVDGMEVPVIEEFGAGTSALHEIDGQKRADLLRDPEFRATFRKQWRAFFPGRAYHRDLDESRIIDCPERNVVGRTFGDIARERGDDPIDCFLDLQAEHGNKLRWYTVIANDRTAALRWVVDHPAVLIGFSDAGAHLRNMAFYNFGLRMLKLVRDAELEGQPFMSTGRAVHRLTAEIADYLGVDGGTLAPGRPADLVVVDPTQLDDRLEAIHEAPMAGFPGLQRYVRRNEGAVRTVLVGGHVAWQDDAPGAGLGEVAMGQLRRPIDRPLVAR